MPVSALTGNELMDRLEKILRASNTLRRAADYITSVRKLTLKFAGIQPQGDPGPRSRLQNGKALLLEEADADARIRAIIAGSFEIALQFKGLAEVLGACP